MNNNKKYGGRREEQVKAKVRNGKIRKKVA